MGTLLDKPITEKKVEHGTTSEFKWVMASMQGWRAEMEDAHTCRPSLVDKVTNNPTKNHFFAVFDGHGGKLVAQESAKYLLDKILKKHMPKGGDDATYEAKKMEKAMYEAFVEFDREHLMELPAVRTHTDCSGTTAITAFILPKYLVIANAGDSRCVLGKVDKGEVVAYPMSHDHKPKLPVERKRIEAAGGHVKSDRVDAELAVSRAFGDFVYKNPELKAEAQKVSPCPDIKIQARSLKDDRFLILACDGIWDVMSNQEVVTFVSTEAEKGWVDVKLIAEALLDKCLAKGSKDNMSVIIIFFSNKGAKTRQLDNTSS